MQNTVECGTESITRPSLKDFELMCWVAWVKWRLPNMSGSSGMDQLELSLVDLILEYAPKLGIDPNSLGILSCGNLTRTIRFIYYQPEIQETFSSMAEFKEEMLSNLHGYKPTETSQQPTLSPQINSQSQQKISDNTWHEGVKFDKDKVRLELIPPSALFDVGRVFTAGAGKYTDRNWEMGIKYSRVYGAIQRHLWSWMGGETNDPEWGYNHLAHAAAGIFFLLHYANQPDEFKAKFDDRPKGDV